MHYEEQARRLGILGGFALGIAVGAGVGLLIGGRGGAPAGGAVTRARDLRAPSGRHLQKSVRGGAAGRMARRKFRL